MNKPTKVIYQDTVANTEKSLKEFNKTFLTKVVTTGRRNDTKNNLITDALSQGCSIILNNSHTFDINSLIYESFFNTQ